MATIKKAQYGAKSRESYKVSGGDYKVIAKSKSTPSGVETKAKLKRTLKGALKGVTKASNLSKPTKTKTPLAEFDIPKSRFGSGIKKAQYGDRITRRQEGRLGRISEKNPERAKEVAQRMRLRATRKKRGRELYNSLEPDAGSRVRKSMEEAREASKAASKAKNGKSFPDLNKDGKITKADILKGRGVIAKKGAKLRNGGSLSGLKGSDKRVGPVDSAGAWTKVQKKTLAGAKGKATLKKDKQLGATKMKKKK